MPTTQKPTQDDEGNIDALKAEMDARLAEMQSKIDEMSTSLAKAQVELQEKEKRILELNASRTGWLVIADNPLYDGQVYGVTFVNGQAFIPDDRVFEQFVRKPMKDSEIEKYPEAERAKIRERESIPSSRLAVEALQDDFHYTVRRFDGEDETLQQIINDRARERAQLQAMLDKMNAGSVDGANLIQPARYGVVSRG